jgi:hypothetical protein
LPPSPPARITTRRNSRKSWDTARSGLMPATDGIRTGGASFRRPAPASPAVRRAPHRRSLPGGRRLPTGLTGRYPTWLRPSNWLGHRRSRHRATTDAHGHYPESQGVRAEALLPRIGLLRYLTRMHVHLSGFDRPDASQEGANWMAPVADNPAAVGVIQDSRPPVGPDNRPGSNRLCPESSRPTTQSLDQNGATRSWSRQRGPGTWQSTLADRTQAVCGEAGVRLG